MMRHQQCANNNAMKRSFAIILCLSMLVSLLCGCDIALPVSIQPKQPELELTGEYPYELPVIVNSAWADKANSAITDALAPLTDALRSANSDEMLAFAAYELQPTDDGYTLLVYISSESAGGSILLAKIYISSDGSVDASGFSIPEYVSDGDQLNGYLRLSRCGVVPALPQPGTELTTADICRVLIDYYESFIGKDVDISAVRLENEDEYFLKATALGLCKSSYEYESNSTGVYLPELNTMLQSLLEHIFTDYLGRSSLYISEDDLLDAMELYFMLYFESPANSSPRSITVSSSDLPSPEDAEALTRSDTALIFNAVFEQCFGELSEPGFRFFSDQATDAVETAYNMSFIDSFPSYGLSSCSFHPREYQLFELVEYYVNTCYWYQWAFDEDESAIDSRALISMLGWVDSYLDSFEAPAHDAVIVDNSRNYQWYFAQFDTGEYSDVNCMPSITAMGIKWYYADSAVTPEALRELWLPERDGGWYMSQVTDSLTRYNVPYEWHDTSESIIAQLDRGRIILTQMSEAAFDASGHCFVIYGYRQLGDSVQFMIHDPGLYDGLDPSGKPPGEAMLLDSAYVQWIIERMTYSYITIG